MRKNRFRFSYKQHLSVFLIFCLLISQTVQVSFFDRTEAAVEDYRDIVSIIVDKDTYSELSSEIKRYSDDIQSYLGDTRVSLLVVDADTPPEAIAAENEKLYYEGDGQDGITSLVGTILIGNIPIPVVHRDGASFPSLYPYVDFDEKRFIYDPRSEMYLFSPNARENTDVEIWHGVINPALGKVWDKDTDVEKIGAFLDKTHDFYTKQGKFTPSGLPPRVFYYDGYNESAAINPRSLYQYSLYIANAENFAYKRFTKHLLEDINAAIRLYDSANRDTELDTYIESLGFGSGSDTIDSETVSTLPDIQTARPIGAFVEKFYQILNQKVLSDQQLFVHNAGRYTSGSTVRIDQATIQATLMDEIALSMIKEGNAAIEKAIDDQIVTGNYARKMIIFDKLVQTVSGAILDGVAYQTKNPYYKTYEGYFFGKKSSTLTSPEQCTIARGYEGTDALYGQSVRVEANTAYDVYTTEEHAEKLKEDTETLVALHKDSKYSCFDSKTGEPKIDTYWGGNSLMRVAIPGYDSANVMNTDIDSDISGYSLPIFSLGGMRETTRLKNPSLADCSSSEYQYGLLQPYIYEYQYEYDLVNGMTSDCTAGWPDEWNTNGGYYCAKVIGGRTPRYTCLTEHETLPSIPSISQSVTDYRSKTCFAGKLYIDGRNVKTGTNTCITQEGQGDDIHDVDNTKYEDRYYHSIPSLWKHVSPTAEEVAAAEANGATPSLPVDIVRSFEFLTPKGNIARFEYPDFFQAPVGDRATLRAWLKSLSESQWNTIITKENATTLTQDQIEAHSYIPATSLPVTPLDWNTLISDAALDKIIQARNWIHPDITEKTKNIVETSLSYSHQYTENITDNPPILPQSGSGYDIAYLGLSSLTPLGDDTDATTLENEYNTGLASLRALNMGSDGVAGPDSDYQSSAQCGPPDGVMIFQWPSAIMCWISTIMPPKISGGSCGGSTIGSSSSSRPRTGPSADILSDTVRLKAYYAPMKLVSAYPKTVMRPGESMSVSYDFITPDNVHIDLPSDSAIELQIVSMSASGRVIPSDQWDDYLEIGPERSPYTDRGAAFAVRASSDIIEAVLQARLVTPLPDGTDYTSVSESVRIRVSDEYIDIAPTVGGKITSTIDTTLTAPVSLDFALRDASGTLLPYAFPYTLDIYDSFDGTLIESGITLPIDEYIISPNYTKKIGNYRFALTDKLGRYGETTLVVRSGPIARTTFSPVSSALIQGSESLGILRLTDKIGNVLTPELHSILIEAKGGYILNSDGERVTSLRLDSIEPELIISYGSTTAGTLTLDISVDGGYETTTDIAILDSARILLERSSTPVVAGDPISVRLKVLDADGDIVTGFSSLASLSLPEGAGYFLSGNTLEIENGQSVMTTFFPGRVSGDHLLSLAIPGISAVESVPFTLLPGQPMYITPSLGEDDFTFTLRDRYGNLSKESIVASLTRNTDIPRSVAFANGVLTEPRVTGYYTLRAPDIADNTLTYTDPSGTYTLTGIEHATLYVPPDDTDFSFLGDYNARYTVLAGGSFLEEGADILYDVDPGASSSLAVSTLLDDPYSRNTLFSVFPGGGYTLGASSERSLISSLSVEKGTPILSVRDDVTHSDIARVGYPLSDPSLSVCRESDATSDTCERISGTPHIRFITLDDTYTTKSDATGLSFLDGAVSLVTYSTAAGWSVVPGVTLVPDDRRSSRVLVVGIEYAGETVGRIIIETSPTESIIQSDDITTPIRSTAIISTRDITLSQAENYTRVFDPTLHGYSIMDSSALELLDENRIGPNHMDSIGSLRETPGVGWQGKNRLLLSYSAGDTVGEASRWFHTYTYVNLGDPVAHVDQGAPGTQREGIDRTIGSQIASSAHGAIESYARADMNQDGYEDITLIYADGFLELLVNVGGAFRSKKMIAYIPDRGKRGISVGDFRGDGYGDIITVDGSGSLILLDNDLRRLTRTRIMISGNASIPLPTGITQFQIYDMDADNRDDIVYLTESGELAILYGTSEVGVFDREVLDSTLGVSLSDDPERMGGAYLGANIPQQTRITTPSTGTGLDETMLLSEVYYQRTIYDESADNAYTETDTPLSDPTTVIDTLSGVLTDPVLTPDPTKVLTYVQSEYAQAFGLDIAKRYKNISGTLLRSGHRVQVDISLTNTTTSSIKAEEYLDTIPSLFDPENTTKYTLTLGETSEDRDFEGFREGGYDARFTLKDIPAGQTLHIIYEVEALPASYGEMIVANLEGDEVGEDIYGDVGFQTSTTCGADLMLWRSQSAREYLRGTRTYAQPTISDDIKSQLTDSDGDGLPDNMEIIDTDGDGAPDDAAMSREDRQSWMDDMGDGTNLSSDTSNLVQANMIGGNILDIGLSDESVSEISTIAQNLSDGLQCGFGGGSCMSFPVNWAPLAPGSAPSLFGIPLGPLTPYAGLPVFSAPTTLPTPWGPIPFIWPGSPIGAGGIFGEGAPYSSKIRIFVTPTLTLGMGVAICMGTPSIDGWLPPPGASPLVSGGKCIVMAQPMPICKGDGSSDDGDIRGMTGLTPDSAWNGESCTIQAKTRTTEEDESLTTSIIEYLKDKDTSRLNAIYTGLSNRGPQKIEGGLVMNIGGGGDGASTVSLDFNSSEPFDLGKIINVKNIRIPAFPDFLMDWVDRQTTEITNKLFTLPNIIIIPPTDLGPNAEADGSKASYLQVFSDVTDTVSMDGLQKEMKKAFGATNVTDSFNKKTTSTTSASSSYNAWLDKTVQANSSTINSVQGSANALKAAYKMIGEIPFLRITQSSVTVNVPWPLPQELDRYARTLDQWTKEIDSLESKWCDGKLDEHCLAEQTSVNISAFKASIDKNLQVIDGYRSFPKKIQDYVTWRQKYTVWAICNIESVNQFTGKWLKENGVRFQKWAEFYVLMKAIVEGSWQPLLDIFTQAEAQCGTCVNQRYNLDYFIYKLIGSLIPTLPIIIFPKWPDIVLDLSDVRFAIDVKVPDFKFNVTPIRLPDLPSLSLPSAPTGSFSLPALPTIPALPDLPPLPELPSLPRISFPPLPPPPKLPKMFGAVTVLTNIVKVFQKVRCLAQTTILVPEWKVGEVIAQRTARQGTLPIDFLNFQLPQFTMPGIKEIRVSSHVNFELQSDFIAEFARTAVKPINEFGTDLNLALPDTIGEDLRINGPENVHEDFQGMLDSDTFSGNILASMVEQLEKDAQIWLDVDTFTTYYGSELLANDRDTTSLDRGLAKARHESDMITREIQDNHAMQVKLLMEYIEAEEAKTKELEKLIDRMQNPETFLSYTDEPMASFVSQEADLVTERLDRYNNYVRDTLMSSDDTVSDIGIDQALLAYERRADRLMAALGDGGGEDSSSYSADGYAPKFEGIYIVTPLGYQTRLFDYISPLTGDETVDVVDIDKDGDNDYIYMMEGILYIKENHTNEPVRTQDTTRVFRDIDNALVPEVPNYFTESVASPGQIELTFSPADSQESSWRLEFFDRYTEWDLTRIDAHDEALTPRTVVDMMIAPDTLTTSDTISQTRISRALSRVEDRDGFSIVGAYVTPVTPDTDFSLRVGRPLYTGPEISRLTYTMSTGGELDILLDPYSRYVFPDSFTGKLQSGKIFFYDTLSSEPTPYTDDLIGMPLIQGMTLSTTLGALEVIDTESQEKTVIMPGGEYHIEEIAYQSDTYTVSFPYQNGFYSARLAREGSSVHAGITLLAPQASLDQGAPIIDLEDTLQIPVYQPMTYPFSDFITEMSTYSVSIDPDVTQDEDGDGIYDNDYTRSASGVTVTDTSIVFGPYSELTAHLMALRVQDEYSNTTILPIRVEIYSPIPQIETVSDTGTLLGVLPSDLTDEPVHLLRIRQGSPIDIIQDSPTLSRDGIFSTGSLFTGSGARFSYSGSSVNISESTGLPVGVSSLKTRVLPATSTDPMRILSLDSDDIVRFEQFLTLPSDSSIRIATGVVESSTPIVTLLERTGYMATLATLTDPNIPGGAYITDSSYTPYAALARDGNIYVLRPGVTLRATTYDGYLMIEVLEGEKNIADVIYQTDFFYTLK